MQFEWWHFKWFYSISCNSLYPDFCFYEYVFTLVYRGKKKRKECGYIEELKQTQDSYSQKIPFARLVLGWGLGTSIWGGFPKKEGWPIMPNYLSKQCGLCWILALLPEGLEFWYVRQRVPTWPALNKKNLGSEPLMSLCELEHHTHVVAFLLLERMCLVWLLMAGREHKKASIWVSPDSASLIPDWPSCDSLS